MKEKGGEGGQAKGDLQVMESHRNTTFRGVRVLKSGFRENAATANLL